ncbi:MAG: hypothetical protein Q9220_000420 [cf. Caloplaca sp. 1 TL-2023]
MDSGSSCSKTPNVLILQDRVVDSIAEELRYLLHKRFHRQKIRILLLDQSDTVNSDYSYLMPDADESLNTVGRLVEWADLLLVSCMRADTLAKMLQGIADTFFLEILRSWDVSKKLTIIPAMPQLMWENPMTRKQLSKIRRKWKWIRILEPLVWGPKENCYAAYRHWTGLQECYENLENQIDLLTLGHDSNYVGSSSSRDLKPLHPKGAQLPSEIWSLILEFTRDWELATALGIYVNLPVPEEWQSSQSATGSRCTQDLQWCILTGRLQDVIRYIQINGPPKTLSRLCAKLIIKFARTDILSYLEANHRHLFWSQFGHAFLPTKASAVFGQTALLDWWQQSPSFLTKEYSAEAIDLASKSGFVHVLQWWRTSGLPMRYTDAALEQASAQGHIEVLDWWRSAFHYSRSGSNVLTNSKPAISQNAPVKDIDGQVPLNLPPLQLKVGKSLIYAAQNGQTSTIRWWMSSGIPTVHEEAVARTASANGHVNVLQLWREIKGEKMQYDNQVLVGPTKNGHVDVLEWWKQSGYRVEYKTCDIEEALEDIVEGPREILIRSWWAKNGLNLGVGTSEWMKVKIL